jgi:hypothetical protein
MSKIKTNHSNLVSLSICLSLAVAPFETMADRNMQFSSAPGRRPVSVAEGIGGRQCVLCRQVLLDLVGGLVRGMEIADLRDQSVA